MFYLMFNLFLEKLRSKWSESFKIKEVKPYKLVKMEDPLTKEKWVVNSQRQKSYLSGNDINITIIPLDDS